MAAILYCFSSFFCEKRKFAERKKTRTGKNFIEKIEWKMMLEKGFFLKKAEINLPRFIRQRKAKVSQTATAFTET